MTEIENGDTTPLKPKKREGSRLDRGFPMGKILLIILGFVFFFQVISALKIINLEREKVIYETDKQIFENRVKLRPELEREIDEFKVKRIELQGEINDLERILAKVKDTLNENKQKSNELKLDNEMYEKRLEGTRGLFQQADAARAQALKEQKMRKNETNELLAKIKELQDDENALNKRLRELKDEKAAYDSRIDSVRRKETEIEVRLAIRKEELQKLQNASNALTGIISNLDSRYKEIGQSNSKFEDAIKDLKDTSATISSSAQEFEQTQSDFKTKLESNIKGLKNTTDTIRSSSQQLTQSQNEAIDNLNNESLRLVKTTTEYSAKIEQVTTNLNDNIVQLSTMGSELANLPLQLNNSANQVDKKLNQRLSEFETNQKQLKELLVNTTSISRSLSSDSTSLNNVLKNVGSAVQKLGVATSNIESKSNDFNEKVSTLDISNRVNLLLDNIKHIYKELDTIKQRQVELVGNSRDLVERIKQSFDQIRNDSRSAIEDVKGLKGTVKEVEEKIENLNIGTEKPNEKEEE